MKRGQGLPTIIRPGCGPVAQHLYLDQLNMLDGLADAPAEFRIFPLGKIKTSKGTFWLTEDDAKACLAAKLDYGNDLSIDYGHGAYEEAYGNPQRAAGWIGGLELRSDGLYATKVSWTETAAKMICSREQRYFSPAFSATDDGHIVEIHNVALTLIPATHKLIPLVASKFKGSKMEELKEMADALEKIVGGLEGIGDEDKSALLAICEKLRSLAEPKEEKEEGDSEELASEDEEMVEASRKVDLLSIAKEVTGKGNLSEIAGALRGLKAHRENGERLSQRLTALETEIKKRDVTDLVNKASRPGKDCKLAPSQRDWAIKLGMTDLSQLQAYLASAPVVAGPPAEEPPRGASAVAATLLSEQEEKIIAATGISKEAYIARKASGKLPVQITD